MSIRQDIIDAVDTQLRTILISNGYNLDLGNNVFHWRETNLTEADFPAIVYRDLNPSEIEHHGVARGYVHTFQVEIVALQTSAATTPAELRKAIQDIYTAVGVDDLWGGLAHDTQPISDDIDIQNKDRIGGAATVIIEIDYLASKWIY